MAAAKCPLSPIADIWPLSETAAMKHGIAVAGKVLLAILAVPLAALLSLCSLKGVAKARFNSASRRATVSASE